MSVYRSFVAIDLPESIRGFLAEASSHLKQDISSQTVRWIKIEGIHLTLKFLGNVPIVRLDQVSSAIRTVTRYHAPFRLMVGGFGCFPNIHRPRVLWIGVKDPSGLLAKLQAELEVELSKLGFERESKTYHPHLTLGRVKHSANRASIRSLSNMLEEIEIGDLGQVEVSEIHLMRSDLQPTGAVYTKLASFKLGEGG